MNEQTSKFGEQKWWSAASQEARWKHLENSSDARNTVRLQCIKSSLSSAWLTVCPSSALRLKLLPAEFVALVKWWLGLPLRDPSVPGQCPRCGEPDDPFGDHQLCCRLNGLWLRHKALVDFLVHVVTAAGLGCTVEERVGNDRSGDLCIRRWKDGKVLMVDVTVRHPLAPSVPLNHTQEELLIGAEKEKS